MKIIIGVFSLVVVAWLSWLTLSVPGDVAGATDQTQTLQDLEWKVANLEMMLAQADILENSLGSQQQRGEDGGSFFSEADGDDFSAGEVDVQEVADIEETPDPREQARQRWQARNDPIVRIERLEAQGFARDEASWILEKEQQMQIDSLHSRWEERRNRYLETPEEFDLNRVNPLRAELGDDAYERYLKAMGRSTAVGVGGIMEGSNAALAGLRPGDEIVRYNGERVFSLRELDRLNVQNGPGASVMVEVIRNGERIQTTMQGGPLGIRARRGRY